MSEAGTVLIAGASGVIGRSAVAHFSELGWRVIAMSRRRPDLPEKLGFEHIPVDLNTCADCETAAERCADVTHVIYAALFEKPEGLVAGWLAADQMQTNLAMMRNLMDPLRRAARGLRHVSVLQGTKAYGAHLHRIRIPARESAPRDQHDNFYWLQEDYIREASAQEDWRFTIWRPQIVFGGAWGVAMNLIPVLGAYAAVCQELGLPFHCPGVHETVMEAVDADLIARALAWAATSPAAADETFNITNGDVFVWANVWPAIARAVGLEPAPPAPISLTGFLGEQAEVWERAVVRHGLRAPAIGPFVGLSDQYSDLLFFHGAPEPPPSILVSTVKLRQAGFGDCVDTEEMFGRWLGDFVQRRLLPRPVTTAGA
ncbi:MAG TPA: NAD-dependent epimerase/dehydratase family protein [Caulobacteraceae bacterium]|jgi:nucleoside-diphosphate-sugar epimerase|nr:NAD-dependent epimerase/dehydratase family protein [Caulobacteraceae bacterium]